YLPRLLEPESEPLKEAIASTFYMHHPILDMVFTILIDIAEVFQSITIFLSPKKYNDPSIRRAITNTIQVRFF
ncbi:hypothetical protein VIGAN_08233100, partial [Vigna angularis var. angularis]